MQSKDGLMEQTAEGAFLVDSIELKWQPIRRQSTSWKSNYVMNGEMYRLWHNNIALPPVKILAGIIVYIGGRLLYLYNAGRVVLVS